MRFALIAGEASGDLLGAALVQALKRRFPDARCCGVTGPRMRAAGCESLADIERLSVMGLAEILPRLPDILRLRRALTAHFVADPVDVVIGIDAPDFNLPLERRLRRAGMKTVHVVSPSVWAWRPGRVAGIVESVDLMLCLLPFEPPFYREHAGRPDFRAEFIGHPLAESLAHPPGRDDARAALGLTAGGPVVALLPGSRAGELRYLLAPFVAAMTTLARKFKGLRIVVPVAKPSLRARVEAAIAEQAPDLDWTLLDGQSREAMCAADAVLLVSGTAALEALLLDRPMVVGYRVSTFTASVLRLFNLLKIDRYSLPNLLCSEAVVPEFIQTAATPANFAAALAVLLRDPAARARQCAAFAPVRETLRRDAADRAASAIAGLLSDGAR